jgi:hypothetical protein
MCLFIISRIDRLKGKGSKELRTSRLENFCRRLGCVKLPHFSRRGRTLSLMPSTVLLFPFSFILVTCRGASQISFGLHNHSFIISWYNLVNCIHGTGHWEKVRFCFTDLGDCTKFTTQIEHNLRVSWILFQNKRHGGSSSDTMALQLTTLIASSLARASKP